MCGLDGRWTAVRLGDWKAGGREGEREGGQTVRLRDSKRPVRRVAAEEVAG